MPHELTHRIFKNSIYVYLKMGFSFLLSAYSTRLLIRYLGVNDFGFYSTLFAAVQMYGFLNASIGVAIQRYFSVALGGGNLRLISKIVNAGIRIQVLFGLITIIMIMISSHLLLKYIELGPGVEVQEFRKILSIMALTSLFVSITTPLEALIVSHEDLRFISVVGILDALLKLIIVTSLFSCCGSDKLVYYARCLMLLSLVTFVVYLTRCKIKYSSIEINYFRKVDISYFFEILKFAGQNLIGVFTSMITFYGSSVILSRFFGNIGTASQNIAGQVNGQLMAISLTFQKVVNPTIDKSEGENNRNKAISIVYFGSKISFFLFAMIALPFFLEAKQLFAIWLGYYPKWTVGMTQILLIATLVEQCTSTLGMGIIAVGKVKKYNIVISFIYLAAFCAIYVFFSSGFSPYSLSLIFLVSTIGVSATKIIIAQKEFGISLYSFVFTYMLKLFFVVLITLLAGIVILNLLEPSVLRLFLNSVVSFMVFGSLFFYFIFTQEEKFFLFSVIQGYSSFFKVRSSV